MTIKNGIEFYKNQLELTRIIQKANEMTRIKKQKSTGRYVPEVILDTSILEAKIDQLSSPTSQMLDDNSTTKLNTIKEEQIMSTSFSSDCVVFPYYTDDAQGLNVMMETYDIDPQRNDKVFKVYDLLANYLNVLMKYQPDFVSGNYQDLSDEKVKVVLRYPIITDDGITSLAFYSEEHFDAETLLVTYVISDFVLYNIVMSTLSDTPDYEHATLEFMMSELYECTETVSMALIDKHFYQLTKMAYITRILEKNTDAFGNCDFSMLRFSVGSYKFECALKSDVMNVQQNDSLVLNFRNWQDILRASFMVSHDADNIIWVDDPKAYVHNLVPITGVGFQKEASSTASVLTAPFQLLPKTDKKRDDYYSNVLRRNRLLEHLDNKNDYTQKRNQVFPKTRGYGAIHKLRDIFNQLGFKFDQFKKIFEYGVAPGTWLKGFVDANDTFDYYHGITPFTEFDLKMNLDVMTLINSKKYNSRIKLIDSRAEDYVHTQKYDLILSDAAFDVKNEYAKQSSLHEEMFLYILCNAFKSLLPGGTIICKIYDLTPELHKLIDHVHDRFSFITIIKPQSSHPLNAEQYLILHDFEGTCPVKRYMFDAELNLSVQFDSIKYFLNKAYNVNIVQYLNNEFLKINIKQNPFPSYIAVPLHLLSLSPSLFKTVGSGNIKMIVNDTGDEELVLTWDAPSYPMANEYYPITTTIKYRHNGISLSIPYIYTKMLYLEQYGGQPHIYYYLHKESSFILNDFDPYEHGIILGPNKPTSLISQGDHFISDYMLKERYNVSVTQFLSEYPLSDYVRGLSFFRLSKKTSFLRNLCRARSYLAKQGQLGRCFKSIDLQNRNVLSQVIGDYEIAYKQGPNRAFRFLYNFSKVYGLTPRLFWEDYTPMLSSHQAYFEHITNKRFASQSYCYEFRRIVTNEQKRTSCSSQRNIRA